MVSPVATCAIYIFGNESESIFSNNYFVEYSIAHFLNSKVCEVIVFLETFQGKQYNFNHEIVIETYIGLNCPIILTLTFPHTPFINKFISEFLSVFSWFKNNI